MRSEVLLPWERNQEALWKSPEEGECAGLETAAPASDSLLYAWHPAESHPAESSQPLCDLCGQIVQTRNRKTGEVK